MEELSFDLRASNLINGLLKKVNSIDDINERLWKVDDFIDKLQDELKKIQVFHRELPLCMLLLNDAILVLKQESTQYRTFNGREPVLEEFIPLKGEPNDEENHVTSEENNKGDDGEDSSRDNKKNWMSSVQLWNADNVPTTNTVDNNNNNHQIVNKPLVSDFQKVEEKRKNVFGDGMHGSMKHKEGSKGFVPMVLPTFPALPELSRKTNNDDVNLPGLSMLLPTIEHPKQDSISSGLSSKFGVSRIPNAISPVSNGLTYVRSGNQQPTSRKQRRCWSPELHRRFVDALTQLGGPQVATPKQIRELMRVDGLTNDEVKSHLQKYRLHTRRVPNTSATSTNDKTNGLATSWTTQDQHSESSKPGTSHSGSPQGPLQFSSMDEDDDEKSETYSWKGQVDRPVKDDL